VHNVDINPAARALLAALPTAALASPQSAQPGALTPHTAIQAAAKTDLILAVNECQRQMVEAERDPTNAEWFQTLDLAGGFAFASRQEVEQLLATAPTPMLAGMAYAEFLSRVMNPRKQ